MDCLKWDETKVDNLELRALFFTLSQRHDTHWMPGWAQRKWFLLLKRKGGCIGHQQLPEYGRVNNCTTCPPLLVSVFLYIVMILFTVVFTISVYICSVYICIIWVFFHVAQSLHIVLRFLCIVLVITVSKETCLSCLWTAMSLLACGEALHWGGACFSSWSCRIRWWYGITYHGLLSCCFIWLPW